MLLQSDHFEDAYKHVKHQAINLRSKVLVCVAGDCDAISACHIFTALLRVDNISYSMHPVSSYDDIEEQVAKLDSDSCCVVLINCGATTALWEKLKLADSSREHLQMIVVDSHRPHNLENVYIDANETDHGKEVSRARVILLDEEWNEHPMPTMETLVAADENGDEEEDENEDEDDDDDLRSPGQRRRLDEEGEREDDKESRQKLREKKELRRESRNELSEYYKGTYRGRSAALTMFQLATQLHKDTNDMLWWAIIGLTEQYVNDLTDRQRYESEVEALQQEVLRHNTLQQTDDEFQQPGSKAHITFDQDFRFMLLQHWTLHQSMYFSNYVSSKLGLWRDRTNNKLDTLLAKMGLSRIEADQKFCNMKGGLKEKLPQLLEHYAPEFGLNDVLFPTFKKQRGFGGTISAADCVQITSAMLYDQRGGESRWADSFFKAFDALSLCASKEDEWEAMLRGKRTPVHLAMELQKEIVNKAFELVQDRGRVQAFPAFRYTHLQVHDSSSWMLQPLALSKLALLLMDIEKEHKNKDSKPMVMGVDDESSETCTIVGVVGPTRAGYKERNKFGRMFEMTAGAMPHVDVSIRGFDMEVIQLPGGNFHHFVEHLQDNLIAL